MKSHAVVPFGCWTFPANFTSLSSSCFALLSHVRFQLEITALESRLPRSTSAINTNNHSDHTQPPDFLSTTFPYPINTANSTHTKQHSTSPPPCLQAKPPLPTFPSPSPARSSSPRTWSALHAPSSTRLRPSRYVSHLSSGTKHITDYTRSSTPTRPPASSAMSSPRASSAPFGRSLRS